MFLFLLINWSFYSPQDADSHCFYYHLLLLLFFCCACVCRALADVKRWHLFVSCLFVGVIVEQCCCCHGCSVVHNYGENLVIYSFVFPVRRSLPPVEIPVQAPPMLILGKLCRKLLLCVGCRQGLRI